MKPEPKEKRPDPRFRLQSGQQWRNGARVVKPNKNRRSK
jgi:hypothetical protein